MQGDITEQEVDAIVNAANHTLLGGGGVDGAIHRRGGPEILAECEQVRDDALPDGLPTGQAVATTAGRLKARWVIHTVGPTYAKTKDKSGLLADCFRNSLAVADELGAAHRRLPRDLHRCLPLAGCRCGPDRRADRTRDPDCGRGGRLRAVRRRAFAAFSAEQDADG